MLCSLSGQIPQEPVVSIKSGHVFEKRLLLKYLEQNQHRCPITNEELDVEKDILAIQVATTATTKATVNGTDTNKPSPAAFTVDSASIPQLLGIFQNEWDALMLETFTLKKHLEQTRQELSKALYQHDAACRVIARLNVENQSLRNKLMTKVSSANGADVEMEEAAKEDEHGLNAEALATIEAKQKELAKKRKDFKKKDGPARAALVEDLATTWSVQSSHTLHDADKPGVTCVAIDPKNTNRIVSGGVDKHVKIFDKQAQQIVATLSGHTKKISDVQVHPSADLIVTASHDKSVKIWSGQQQSYSAVHSLSDCDDAVTMASIHTTGDYVISSSLDATWALHDIRSGKLLARCLLSGERFTPSTARSADEALCAQFHPDGGIFGTGSKNQLVQMWDVRSLQNVVTFEGHTSPVQTLCFSENGYQLASGSHDGMIKFWDLRKLKSVCEVDLSTKIHYLQYDPSGTHVVVAGQSNLHVLKEVGKTDWQVVKSFDDHKAAVTSVQFAPDSSYFVSSSMDRSVKIFSR